MDIEIKDVESLNVGSKPSSKLRLRKVLVPSLILAVVGFFLLFSGSSTTNAIDSFWQGTTASNSTKAVCPIQDIVRPSNYEFSKEKLQSILHDVSFKEASIKKLSGAVQIPTEVYDNLPNVDELPEFWAKFKPFHTYLEETFPILYSNLKVEKVNTYGLLYTWKGSDSDLKPLVLMAHQDVVPVQLETIDDWDYAPFSGHYDGTLMFGRGVSDCKNLLIGLLEAVEELIKDDFKPKRSVILSFGFDEEVSGIHGASALGKFLLERYGEDSVYAIVDEGSSGITKLGGRHFASPATGEKGYFDADIQLTTPGGHSSVPPDHTSIGIAGDLAHLIESDPFKPILTDKNPILGYLQCAAENSPEIDPILKKNILRSPFDKLANAKVIEYLSQIKLFKYLCRTSQAIDIIQGGAKANALPEHVSIIVNHRVAIESSVEEAYNYFLTRVDTIAKKYDLGLISRGKEIIKPTVNGYFNVSFPHSLEPAPISPTSGDVWATFAGSIRHFFEDIYFVDESVDPFVVTPNIMTGNTDTRWYWKLTNHIYRYIPSYSFSELVSSGVHSVNERLEFDTHLHVIAFYYEYLQIVSEVSD